MQDSRRRCSFVGGREGQDRPRCMRGRELPGSPSFRPRVTGFSVGEAKKHVGSLENWFIWGEERERWVPPPRGAERSFVGGGFRAHHNHLCPPLTLYPYRAQHRAWHPRGRLVNFEFLENKENCPSCSASHASIHSLNTSSLRASLERGAPLSTCLVLSCVSE